MDCCRDLLYKSSFGKKKTTKKNNQTQIGMRDLAGSDFCALTVIGIFHSLRPLKQFYCKKVRVWEEGGWFTEFTQILWPWSAFYSIGLIFLAVDCEFSLYFWTST